MSLVSMNSIGWFEIYTQDIARASQFYSDILSVTFEHSEIDGFVMRLFPSNMEAPGSAGALAYHPDFPAGNNSTIVYFNSPDCGAVQAKIDDAGGEVIRPKFSIGEHGFIVLAKDTEGNMIGIHSMT